MKIKMFDKVLLKTGETAYIVEVYEQGLAYEADIDKPDGRIKTDTIRHEEIVRIVPNDFTVQHKNADEQRQSE